MKPESLADLHRKAFGVDRAWQADAFASLLAQTPVHLTSARHGFALWRAVAGEAELLTIAVHPDAQRQGVGTTLMRGWMAEAATQADCAFLEVADDNHPACALYRHCGFAEVARRARYYARARGAVDALVMRAPLQPAQPVNMP